ncbi:MAG: hypothetical protein ACP5OG_04560 [Candidatus Nanoarchaeia archaeon]
MEKIELIKNKDKEYKNKKSFFEKIYFFIFVGIILFVLFSLVWTFYFKEDKAEEKADLENPIYLEAKKLYDQKKSEGIDFKSQCLGAIEANFTMYVVDIVNVPRDYEDNRIENQCFDYRSGRIKNFIELDRQGNLVKIYNGD